MRLNPCFNGRYSQRVEKLVKSSLFSVLILVLMEDTLREQQDAFSNKAIRGLNPCFNGRYSQSPNNQKTLQ